MHTLTIYYYVTNGGDGSAYPAFCESQEIANLMDDWQSKWGEGWGEQCTGSISFQSDSIIFPRENLITKESLLVNLEEDKRWMDKEEYESKIIDLQNLKEGI